MIDIAPQHNFSLYPSFGDFYFDPLMPVLNPYSGKNVEYGPRHVTRETARSFWTSKESEKSLGSPDIIHSNNFWSPARTERSRLVYTFYDMGFLVEPAWTTEANRLGCFEGVFKSSVSADWIVAISKASRDHYLEVFPHFSEDRIRVIYPCSRFSDSSLVGKRPKAIEGIPSGGFWLNVGTVEPRKNQRRLTDAYARYLAAGGPRMPLVLAGGKGWLMEDFQIHLKELGIEDQVVMTGYVSDDELIWLYRNCYANLYPSLFEGFGLPVLEGMQFGAATITTTSSSVPEVAGDAAILLDPMDIESWTQAMLRIAANRNERDALGLAAVKQAGCFDWRRSATALLQMYDEALASPKRCKSA
ncbi:glycosyltransferase family 4 protein [Paraburkholderia acidipaludis]|uniref:glycosyltransferase family 4 protein n=1 Tax=Paraburkholderia acidipaludis TaxID=660537 RepID=UPI001FDF83A8|nr:glycosyltransferase family 1 protein [Paraburkholderia acidipaludis]